MFLMKMENKEFQKGIFAFVYLLIDELVRDGGAEGHL
jgi:hypothetical protein